jgi:hypothetical protein
MLITGPDTDGTPIFILILQIFWRQCLCLHALYELEPIQNMMKTGNITYSHRLLRPFRQVFLSSPATSH